MFNKKIILWVALFNLFAFNFTSAVDDGYIEKFDNILERGIENSIKGLDWANQNRPQAGVIVGLAALIGSVIFQEQIKTGIRKIKDFAVDKYYDVLVKLSDIKSKGITFSDVRNSILALSIVIGLYLARNCYSKENLKIVVLSSLSFLRKNKVEGIALIVGIIIGKQISNIYKSMKHSKSNELSFDKFLDSLTDDQKRIIFNSDSLLVTVNSAESQVADLLNNEEFKKILNPSQLRKLEQIVAFRKPQPLSNDSLLLNVI